MNNVPIAEEETGFEDIIDEECNEDNDAEASRSKKTISTYLMAVWFWCSERVFTRFESFVVARWGPVENMAIYKDTTEVIWSIDAYARRIFPLVFLILQIMYWTSYLYVM